jgi:hypothetical protein
VRHIVNARPDLRDARSARAPTVQIDAERSSDRLGGLSRAVGSAGGVRRSAAIWVSAAACPDLEGAVHRAVVGGVSLPLTRQRRSFLRRDVSGSRA